jgi:hypothetical protein
MGSSILVDGNIKRMGRERRLGMDWKLYPENMFIRDSFWTARGMAVGSWSWMALGRIRGSGLRGLRMAKALIMIILPKSSIKVNGRMARRMDMDC